MSDTGPTGTNHPKAEKQATQEATAAAQMPETTGSIGIPRVAGVL
jgi:hypothetical protein